MFSPLYTHGKPGHNCGVIGIGGLGHLALKFGKEMGMKMTAITGSGKPEEMKKLGASQVINSRDEKELGKY